MFPLHCKESQGHLNSSLGPSASLRSSKALSAEHMLIREAQSPACGIALALNTSFEMMLIALKPKHSSCSTLKCDYPPTVGKCNEPT